MGGVDERGAQVEPAGGAQLGQQPLVQLLPDPDGLPVPQSPPAGHPRAAEHRWSIPPGHPGPQDEHDPGQRGSVVHRPATWIAEPSWPGRDQRCQPPPQLVSEHVVQHPTTPTAQRSSGVRPTRARCETRSKPSPGAGRVAGPAPVRSSVVCPADPSGARQPGGEHGGPAAQAAGAWLPPAATPAAATRRLPGGGAAAGPAPQARRRRPAVGALLTGVAPPPALSSPGQPAEPPPNGDASPTNGN